MKHNQTGFGALEVLLTLIFLSIVSFGGYYVWNNQKKTAPNKEAATAPETKADTATTSVSPESIKDTETTKNIKLVTGRYLPTQVNIKKGMTVNWTITDLGDAHLYGIASDDTSSEVYSSGLLTSGKSFSHTFTSTGDFSWHDTHDASLVGVVTVTD